MQIYERDVMFRQQVGNLQLIVGIYNNVQGTILPVEKPLITQKLEAVDGALKKGLQACCSSCISFAIMPPAAYYDSSCIYMVCHHDIASSAVGWILLKLVVLTDSVSQS